MPSRPSIVGGLVLPLIYANSRVGSIPSRAIGWHQAEEQDTNGEFFHNFVLDNGMWIPATFDSNQEGLGGTWRHPKTEKWIRGDFVCLPLDWQFSACKAFIDPQLDISLRVEDHCAASVHLAWQAQLRPPGRHHSKGAPYIGFG